MFPDRREMLYREHHHKCPLDTREISSRFRSGCFYTCRYFNDGLQDIEKIKALYDKTIIEATKFIQDMKVVCKGCKGEITGFDSDGYCEDCLCDECGSPLETETERAIGLCDDCDDCVRI
jgi:hypothetical protein